MFRDLKEYQEIAKIYTEKVSKPEDLDENRNTRGQALRMQREKAKQQKTETPPAKATPETKSVTVTPMSKSGAQITTNQKQSREIASKNKDVELNKFSRTKTYGADEKGVKLVPGSKVGQKVNRSTVFTKADRDIKLGGKTFKKGEKLGVLTRNQRRKYDLMTAPKEKQEVKTEPPKETTTPPTENKGKLRGGQGGRPLGDTTRRQGGTVKSGVTLFKKGEDAKKFTDKTGFASKVDTVKGKDPKITKKPVSGNTSALNVSATTKNKSGAQSQGVTQVKDNAPTAKDTPEVSKFTKQGKVRTKAQMMAAKRIQMAKSQNEEYTPYDIVLEYLLSTEQAATIEEANYIMTEMDAETIKSIVAE